MERDTAAAIMAVEAIPAINRRHRFNLSG